MELWDILNVKGEPTGKTVVRGSSTLRSGEYHLVVHIWPVNEYGSLLIQKRSKTKRLMPGIWAATGGAAISGESSFTAAARELYEELGIPSSEDSLRFVTRIKRRALYVAFYNFVCFRVCVNYVTGGLLRFCVLVLGSLPRERQLIFVSVLDFELGIVN